MAHVANELHGTCMLPQSPLCIVGLCGSLVMTHECTEARPFANFLRTQFRMFRRSTLTGTVVMSMVILPRRPLLDVVVVDEHLKWNDGRRSTSTKEDVDSPLASDASGRV